MQAQRIMRAYFFQDPALRSAAAKVVFTMDLEPFDLWALFKKLQMVLSTQPDACMLRLAGG